MWYISSLSTLWLNKYLLSTLEINSNVVAFAQVGMSIFCGKLYQQSHKVPEKQTNDKVCLSMQVHIIRDVLALAIVRACNVVMGLTALRYVAASFTETVKSSAPFFTVVLTYVMLRQKTTLVVTLSLVPIVLGLILCSLTEISFNLIGFLAAMTANCLDCVQNVMTKRLLNRSYTVGTIQLYTSIIGGCLQLPVALIAFFTTGIVSQAAPFGPMTVAASLVFDGFAFYLQSLFAYCVMQLVSPVSHSVANTAKRAILILMSIHHYGHPVLLSNWLGMLLILIGVFGYNHAISAVVVPSKGPISAVV